MGSLHAPPVTLVVHSARPVPPLSWHHNTHAGAKERYRWLWDLLLQMFFSPFCGTLLCSVPCRVAASRPAFLFTLAVLHLLVLWRLLVCASPGGRSPLKSLTFVPCAKVPMALVLPWGYACCPAYAATVEPKDRRRALGQRSLPFWFRVLVLLGSLPAPVWGVPQDIASALTEAHAAVTPDPARSGSAPADNGPPDSPCSAFRPDDLSAHGHTSAGSSQDVSARDYRAAVEADIAARGSSSCLQAQSGLCIQSPGINVPARVTLCVPGHRLITSEIMLTLPATLEDFVDRVYEAAPSPLDDCWNKLIPATPQLNDGAATLLVAPHWFKHAGLATVLFDARSMTGKVFAEVLPNHTSLDAISRIVGPSVITPFEVFVAGSLQPIQPGREVHLEEGDTLCLAPAQHLPLRGPSLTRSLQQPTPWLSMDPVPATARALCVLILHESGKYLYSDLVQCDWQNCLRITHFVGVEMSESRLVSACDLTSLIYHGTPVRGIIALLRRSTERDHQNRPLPAVLFIDGRPVGQDVNFCVLDHYHVSREFLQGYVRCPTPPGHRLAVMGGQLQGNGFNFHSGEVLTLAFLPADQGVPEAGESEPGGSDDPFDPSDRGYGSDESTRSRSRQRDVSLSKASGDSSYQSHLPAPADASAPSRKTSQAVSRKWVLSAHPLLEFRIFGALGLPVPALQFGGKLNTACSVFTCPLALKCESHSCPAARIDVTLPLHMLLRNISVAASFRPPVLAARLGDTPSLQARVSGSSQGDGIAQLPAIRDLHDRSPTRWQPPDFAIAAPEFVDNPPPPVPLRALFVVLCEDYRPEVIPLTFWQPVDYFLVIREVQALRLPDVRRYFPRLLAIEPSPARTLQSCWDLQGCQAPSAI